MDDEGMQRSRNSSFVNNLGEFLRQFELFFVPLRSNIHKYVFIMARPIKETPILYGEDARRFEARMQERRRISAEERARINAAYEAVKSVCDFM